MQNYIATLDKLDNYCKILKSVISQLRTASFMGRTDEAVQMVRQANVVMNEIDNELRLLRDAEFKTGFLDAEVKQKLSEILLEANETLRRKYA